MKKILSKTISAFLAFIMCTMLISSGAFALDAGEKRVAMGADLPQSERNAIYSRFGINYGDVKEIQVTNKEEREYLEGLVSESKIGNVALSCVYIETLEEGKGIDLSVHNIKWCTEDMYKNAMITAGITDARVMVDAPHPVTGTAALTGMYKAYEDITGKKLDENAKQVGTEELVVTGELADYIGSEDATKLITELKKILDVTKDMTDDEVRSEIRKLAKEYNIELTDLQVDKLLELCRSLEGLNVDELRQRINDLANTVKKASTIGEALSKFAESVKNFFVSIGEFFSKLFGGGDD